MGRQTHLTSKARLAIVISVVAIGVCALLISTHRTSPARRLEVPNPSTATQAEGGNSKPRDTSKPVSAPEPSKAEAPTAKFERVSACAGEASILEFHKRQTDCDWYANKQQFQKFYADCLNNVAGEQAAIEEISRKLISCRPAELTPGGVFDATAAAALAGDQNAQICFVAAVFMEDRRAGKTISEEDERVYKQLAPAFIESAFARGDWRIVALLSRRIVDEVNRLLASIYDIGTPETLYKMNRLLQLGASERMATDVGNSIAAISLSPAQQAAAEQWARDTYNARFASNPRLEAMPTVCAHD
jgi:hypothetical protein